MLFRSHPDHLGSTDMVTSEVGQLVDHILYFPFGEVWVEERPKSLPEEFFFTAKELDPETGFYDFGARYLNPLSKWMSTDPALGAFLPKAGKDIAYRSPSATNRWRAHVDLPGLGGAFEPTNLATYAYSHHNPATLTDPTGLWSAAAHDYIIDVSLLGVASKNDISTIKAASRAFDATTQGVEQAHMHSMTPPGFTPAKAIAKRDRFIEAKLIEARDFEQAGDRTAALRAFGEAIHPIMDSSSPLHVDPQGNPLPARSLFGVLVGRA